MNMLDARVSIKYNEEVLLSVQHSIDCNYYNQGCDGGYPYLVGKYASEDYLVPDDCHKY